MNYDNLLDTNDRTWIKLVDKTAAQLHAFCIKKSLNEVTKCIAVFYINCSKEFIRVATMELIVHTHALFATPDAADSCIQQILLGFEAYVKGKNERFLQQVFNGTVSNSLWKRCLNVSFHQSPKSCEFSLDYLFHIRKPELEKMKTRLYSRVRELLHTEKYSKIGEEWIQIFNFDAARIANNDEFNQPSGSNTSDECPSPTQDKTYGVVSWQKLVEDTVTQVQSAVQNGLLHTNCVNEFYKSCPADLLRLATMKLIVEIHKSLSTMEESKSSVVLQTILSLLKSFSKTVNNDFINDGYVWGKLWDEGFQIVVAFKVKKCSAAIDMLFHIRQPETKKRSSLIYESIRKLLLDEKTFNNGIEWIQCFGLVLEKLKIQTENSIDELFQHHNDVDENDLQKIKELQEGEETVIDLSPKSPTISPSELRSVTMKRIVKVFDSSNAETNRGELLNKVHGYYKKCEATLKDKDDEFVRQVCSAEVSDDLWKNAWKRSFEAALKKNLAKCTVALDQLFSVKNPENSTRKSLIEADVQKLFDKEETFMSGIQCINAFSLLKLKEENFEKIVYNSFNFGKERFYNNFWTSPEEKLQCLRILDDCLLRAEMNQLKNEVEKNLMDAFNIEKLSERICKFASIFEINIEPLKFHAFRVKFIHKVKHIFSFIDRQYFELHALEILKGKDETFKLDFVEVIALEDKKYAYCWARHLNIPPTKMPEVLKNCESFNLKAKEFIKMITQKVHRPVDRDYIEYCQFWKKTYKLITVMTPEGFKNFIDEHLIREKPKVIGIDCEGQRYGQKAVVLQLATTEWACLIDLQELSKELSINKWKHFFKILFNPDITLVGFAFKYDYNFLCNAFDFLPKLLKEIQAKVLCLQNFVGEIIDAKCKNVFLNKPNKGCGLATLTNSVLGFHLDKTEQQSKWHKRPLTQFQKIYAVTDALVVVLIKDEIEKRLKEEIGEPAISKMMEKAYVIYQKEKKNAKNTKRLDDEKKNTEKPAKEKKKNINKNKPNMNQKKDEKNMKKPEKKKETKK